MKVAENALAGAAGLPASKTHGATRPEQGTHASGGRVSGSGDRVEVSSLAGNVSRALAGSGRERAARVEGLAAAYRAGTYRVDAPEVARALVTESLHAEL